MLDTPQTIAEAILVQAAQERGAQMRLDTEYLGHAQDETGVTSIVRVRLIGTECAVPLAVPDRRRRARSKVAADAGLPFEGPSATGGAMNIVIEAGLSHFVARRPSVLYWMLQPGPTQGCGLGVLRMIKPWHEWMLHVGLRGRRRAAGVHGRLIRELAVELVSTEDFEIKVSPTPRGRSTTSSRP